MNWSLLWWSFLWPVIVAAIVAYGYVRITYRRIQIRTAILIRNRLAEYGRWVNERPDTPGPVTNKNDYVMGIAAGMALIDSKLMREGVNVDELKVEPND